jgi:L-threonylcarbamoyladenylate synthase
MKTRVTPIDPRRPDARALEDAAAILRGGGLVAFPTETVYGLGASALDTLALARIFQAKGRPANNPLIVHVPDLAAAQPLVREFPETARRLAERFWPGPLTLVLPKSNLVPDIVSAGGPTVGLRVPAHPVALALLRACALPLAAPSANLSSLLSPTTAEHVLRGLAGKIDLVLDAGPTPGGLESTVVDVSESPPRLLRPGLVSLIDMEQVVGKIASAEPGSRSGEPARSPGQSPRHYAPRTPLEIAADGYGRVQDLIGQGRRIGWVTFTAAASFDSQRVVIESLPAEAAAYAAELYAALHRLDAAGVEQIIVDLPPGDAAWLAVHDRLRRASAGS